MSTTLPHIPSMVDYGKQTVSPVLLRPCSAVPFSATERLETTGLSADGHLSCDHSKAPCLSSQAIVRAALEMHKECDTHGSLVIKRFAEFRSLKRLAHDIGRKGSASNIELPDPRAVRT